MSTAAEILEKRRAANREAQKRWRAKHSERFAKKGRRGRVAELEERVAQLSEEVKRLALMIMKMKGIEVEGF